MLGLVQVCRSPRLGIWPRMDDEPALRTRRAVEHSARSLEIAGIQVTRSADAWIRGDTRLATAVIATHRKTLAPLRHARPQGGPRAVAKASAAAIAIGEIALEIAEIARVTPRDARIVTNEDQIALLRRDAVEAIAAARTALSAGPRRRLGTDLVIGARGRLLAMRAAGPGERASHPASRLVAERLVRVVGHAAEIVDQMGTRRGRAAARAGGVADQEAAEPPDANSASDSGATSPSTVKRSASPTMPRRRSTRDDGDASAKARPADSHPAATSMSARRPDESRKPTPASSSTTARTASSSPSSTASRTRGAEAMSSSPETLTRSVDPIRSGRTPILDATRPR
jgi:hypothetical protein